jgi:TolB-like protein/Flp pilus assembly protein TadD
MLATADIFLFEEFRLDRQGEGLSRRIECGVFVPVPIGLRALDVLRVLVERPGKLVTKEEIIAAVWGRTVVENANLTVQISALRRVLDQGRAEGSCIRTVAARGYRFVAPVTRVEGAAQVPTAGPASVSPRLAIVVLPFANLSDDPRQGYFADGITDDLTTDLSWTPELFVISRSAAFAYRGKSVDPKQIGQELNVNYVVEGSLRATGSHLQVNVQLIDTESGAHVWADRFETDGNDLSIEEAEITGRLLWDLRRNLFAAATRRAERDGCSNGDAKTIAMRGWSVFHRPRSAANIQEALQLWERALNIDPGSMSAKIGIALGLASNFSYGWSTLFRQDEARAERLLLDVFAVDPSDITARITLGILRRLQGRLDESKIALESVIALDRNVAGLRQLGATLVYLGQPEAAIQPLKRSIRLSPYEANIGLNYTYLGLCHLLVGRFEKAIHHLRMARTSNPRIYIVHFYLAAALGLNGDFDEARTALAEGIRLKPELDSPAAWCTYRPWETNPQYLALRTKTLDVGLRQAGFADGPTPHEAHAPAVSLTAGSRAEAPRLSIVVLPFINLGNDPDQEYVADGLTDDLTTDLSRIAGSFVIARGTAFTYKDKAAEAKQVGRELGVRYVLEGSVRRSGNQVRVNAQLIDAATDAHLWAERFDCDTDDLLALQDDITSQIAVALDSELVIAEAARLTGHPGALDYIFRGRAALYKPTSRDNLNETVSFFEHALALDPRSVEAQSYLAIELTARVLEDMSDTAAADIARAEGLAGKALAASPRSGLAHFAKGQVLRTQHRYGEAISEYEMALAFNRYLMGAYAPLGWCKLHTGSIDELITLAGQAIRLSPRDPLISSWYSQTGVVHLLQSRTREAIVWFEKARSANPLRPIVHAHLASAYALNGEFEHAVTELGEARRLSGDDRYTSIDRLKAVGFLGVAKIRALHEATYFAGLRKAGMPEE